MFIALKSDSLTIGKCSNEFDLEEETPTRMGGQGIPVARFNSDEWLCHFAYIVDINTHMNKSNILLYD
jgi:hypothetical protein